MVITNTGFLLVDTEWGETIIDAWLPPALRVSGDHPDRAAHCMMALDTPQLFCIAEYIMETPAPPGGLRGAARRFLRDCPHYNYDFRRALWLEVRGRA